MNHAGLGTLVRGVLAKQRNPVVLDKEALDKWRHGSSRPPVPQGYRFDMWAAIGLHMSRYGAPPPAARATDLIRAATRPFAAAPTIPLPTATPNKRRCRRGSPRSMRVRPDTTGYLSQEHIKHGGK